MAQDISGVGIAHVNPYRYRGYYLDEEIGLYYLQSRYYNPELGRFINADDVEYVTIGNGILEHNLYTYCKNEPVMNVDENGHWVVARGISLGVAVIMGVCVSVVHLQDSKKQSALAIYFNLITLGVAEKGFALSSGFFWAFETIYDYQKAVTGTHSIAYGVGIDVVHYYPNYRTNNFKAKLAGIQITFLAFGITYTASPMEILFIDFQKNKFTSVAAAKRKVNFRIQRVRK